MPPIFAFYRTLDIIADESVKVNTFEKIVGKRLVILFGKKQSFSRSVGKCSPRSGGRRENALYLRHLRVFASRAKN
jgi:hypothetical protein